MFDFSNLASLPLPVIPPPPPPPPPPPAEPVAAPAQAAPADALNVGQNAGIVATAATFDFGPLPFDPAVLAGMDFMGPLPTVAELPEGPLKEAATATVEAIVEASNITSRDFIDGLKGTFSEAGIQALENLNTQGKLDALDPTGGQNLRDSIKGFLDGGGDKGLAEALVRQVEAPGLVTQICDNTCAAATAQAGWATTAPAEYFRTAAALATTGEATITRDGKAVKLQVDEGYGQYRATSNMAAIKEAGLEGADKVDASVQSALMNLGAGGTYDIRQDKVSSSLSLGEYGSIDMALTGLSMGESQSLFGSLLKMPFAAGWTYAAGESGGYMRDAAAELAEMKQALAGGAVGAFTMIGSGASTVDEHGAFTGAAVAHAVAVIGMKDGNVEYFDPRGKLQSVPEAEFVSMMSSVDPNSVIMAGIGGGGTYGTSATSYASRYPRRG